MSFESWENPLWGALIVSFVGVFVSTLILIWGLVGEYKDPHSSVMIELGARVLKKFPLLVIVGVAGELLFNTVTFVASITLDVLHSAEVAQARIEASNANKAAGEANERAGIANRAAGDANKLAGDAFERAAKANERAANLEVAAAILKAKNLELERQQADTQRQVSVRPISDDQRDRFVNSIEGHQRTITLILPDDQEARAFGAERVQPMIKKAGFAVKIEDLHGTSKHVGIVVCDNGPGETVLYGAFKKAKIPARIFKPSMTDYPDFCHPRFGGETTLRVYIGQRDVPH